jgi:hypothetical protein
MLPFGARRRRFRRRLSACSETKTPNLPEQLLATTERGDADLPKVCIREVRQRIGLNVMLPKRSGVLAAANVFEPLREIEIFGHD